MSSKTKTTATKEEAKPALVPKLRFPEFREAEGWNNKTLGQMGSFIRGLTYTPGDVADSGLLVLRSGNIQDGSLVFDKDLVFVEKACTPDLLLRVGDVVICMSNGSKALVGKSAEYRDGYSGEVTIGAFCSLFRPSNPFSKIAFRSEQYSDFIADSIMGGNINNLKNSTLEGFPFPVPPTKGEQQKIAECLSSVDELMAAQARKVDALKTHKKGLMQRLFPREGETQPRLRFPEFQNAGEWEEKRLGSVCDIQRGKFSHRPRNDPRFFGGPYPFIQTGDVVKSEGGAVIASQSLNEEGLAVSKLFKPAIVLITVAANIGDTGLLQTEGCFTDSVVGLIPKENVIPVFLELIMRGQKEYLNKVATTGAQKNINNEILREASLLLPSVHEQQHIATCLSSLDALITAETQKHEALKTHKKGLMQQLFPSPAGVAA